MSFVNEKPVKAVRKRHVCSGCNKFVEIGEAAINWAGMTDGDFSSAYYHPECRAAEVGINGLHGLHNDEWMGLVDADWEDFPWLKAKHPVAYRWLLMTREQRSAEIELAGAPA